MFVVFHGVLSHFMLLFYLAFLVVWELRCFVGKLRCFVAEFVLSNDKYEVAHAGPKVDKTFEHWLA